MKRFLKLLPIYLLVLIACGYGIWQFIEKNQMPEVFQEVLPPPPTKPQKLNTEIMPKNVISMGDTFEYWPSRATGHFQCRITGVSVVKDPSECPPVEMFMEKSFFFHEGYENAEHYAQGARIVLVELELTNIDAEGYAYDGTISMSCGWFKDPYVFYPDSAINLADLAVTHGEDENLDYDEYISLYFSERYAYMPEDDPDTMGVEPSAIRIAPGETKTYTLGFPIGGRDGKPIDMTMLRAVVAADSNHLTGLFIDLELEDE